jgi:hypothetical protein
MDIDGIKKEDTLDIQARITLLNLAPSIVTNAIKAGWISYPAKAYVDPEEQDLTEWLKKYDCEKAYNLRQKGMTYREIGKLLCVGIGRVTEILRRGEEIAVQRKLDEIGVKPIDLPKKSTVEIHTTLTKQRKNTKR